MSSEKSDYEEQCSKKAKIDKSGEEEEDMKKLENELVKIQPDLIPELSDDEHPNTTKDEQGGSNFVRLNRLMQIGFKELQMIVAWARKVPGFNSLLINDRCALVKSSFMDINILRLSFRSLETPGCLRFSKTEFVLTLEESVELGWAPELMSISLNLVEKFRCLKLDVTEFSILNAVLLLYPDAVGLSDRGLVMDLQDRMLKCLCHYCTRQHPKSTLRYGKIMLLLPCLRSASARALENFMGLARKGQIELNDELINDIMNG